MTKWVYAFGDGTAEGTSKMRELLGGKGANLAEMANLGLPVPPGFTITTDLCTYFYDNGRKYPPDLEEQVNEGLAAMGRIVGHVFGSQDDPVLVSVRSGARASMPGMMDTVLNLGLSDHTVEAIAKRSGNPRFAYDSYRRFIQMYSNVVLDIDHHQFEEILEEYKERKSFTLDTDLKAEDWKKVIVFLQGQGRGGDGQAVPAGPEGPAVGGDRRRVRLVDEPARRHLPPPAEHSRPRGAPRSTCSRWCSATWVTPRRRGWHSPATLRRASPNSMASS